MILIDRLDKFQNRESKFRDSVRNLPVSDDIILFFRNVLNKFYLNVEDLCNENNMDYEEIEDTFDNMYYDTKGMRWRVSIKLPLMQFVKNTRKCYDDLGFEKYDERNRRNKFYNTEIVETALGSIKYIHKIDDVKIDAIVSFCASPQDSTILITLAYKVDN